MSEKMKCEICEKRARWLDVRNLDGVYIKHYYCARHVKRAPNGAPIGIPLR